MSYAIQQLADQAISEYVYIMKTVDVMSAVFYVERENCLIIPKRLGNSEKREVIK